MSFKFYETTMGKRFFESQLPELTKALNRMATAMEQNTATQEAAQQPVKFESNTSYLNEMYESAKHSQVDLGLCLRPCAMTDEVQRRLHNVIANKDLAERFAVVIEDNDKFYYNKGRDVAQALLANDVNALLIALTGWGVDSLLNLAEYGTPRRENYD